MENDLMTLRTVLIAKHIPQLLRSVTYNVPSCLLYKTTHCPYLLIYPFSYSFYSIAVKYVLLSKIPYSANEISVQASFRTIMTSPSTISPKFLSASNELGVVAVGFSGGQVIPLDLDAPALQKSPISKSDLWLTSL